MKTLALFVLLTTGLAIVAPAAVTTGIEVGYLTDNKDAIWSGRVGWEFKTDSNFSHQVELEYGYTKHSESGLAPAPLGMGGTIPFSQQTKLQPLTINYRAETTPADKLGYYFGAGVGETRARLSFPGSGAPTLSSSDNAFTVQAFAGVNYKVTPNATVHLGMKYLWIDDVTLFGSIKAKVGDDLALTAGVSVKF